MERIRAGSPARPFHARNRSAWNVLMCGLSLLYALAVYLGELAR